jgi:hypothetical protein
MATAASSGTPVRRHLRRAPEDITNAYIVWSITESGKDDDVSKELAKLAGQAKESKAILRCRVANALLNRDGRAEAVRLLRR